MPNSGSGPFKARFQQTMLRIKDPRVSVPFYCDNFGMTLVHWIRFEQWNFTVYFLERQREGQESPPCTPEQTSVECERYLQTMDGTTVELTHNHGSEDDPEFKVWNGNTGKDAGQGPNFAPEPEFRGFGHLSFGCDDVFAACEKLEANGVIFQRKPIPDQPNAFAFALDPDGYWLQIVARKEMGWPEYFNLSRTGLRVKHGPSAVDFYVKNLGMRLARAQEVPEQGFSKYYLVSCTPPEWQAALDALPEEEREALTAEGFFDPSVPNSLTDVFWNPFLELIWNHGTEEVEKFSAHDGNKKPQGFGHIGFLVDDLEETCAQMEFCGVFFKKKPEDGNMRGIAFIYDLDGYWIELIDRQATFVGTCSNY